MFIIECYADDGALAPYMTERADTERDARRVAARMLGHTTLRGASTWQREQGGTVFQFGPRSENGPSNYEFVVIADAEGK